jgi:hypothetical protein
MDQPVARPLHTQRITQTQNNRIQIIVFRVGSETTTSVFERAKTANALDSAANEIGKKSVPTSQKTHIV